MSGSTSQPPNGDQQCPPSPPLPGDPAEMLGLGIPSNSADPEAGVRFFKDAGIDEIGEVSSSHRHKKPPEQPFARDQAFATIEQLAPLFPGFSLIQMLGAGGMGAVYKARQNGLDRLVAVKILPPHIGRNTRGGIEAFRQRFTREARALAKLSHANIVTLFNSGCTAASEFAPEGLFFIVMEFVDGVSLRDLLCMRRVDSREAMSIVMQVCEALQFAHDEGIVHRDIKPENILIDWRGRVKIADFGLAKMTADGEEDLGLTAPGGTMGTPRYMAPEQMEGAKDVDHRADIYSLGVVFYELLTGELPLGRFAPPSQRVQIDVRLDEIVLTSLAKEPEKRYQHASDVNFQVDAVRRSAEQVSLIEAPPRKLSSTGIAWRSVSAVILIVIIAFLLAGLPGNGHLNPVPVRAPNASSPKEDHSANGKHDVAPTKEIVTVDSPPAMKKATGAAAPVVTLPIPAKGEVPVDPVESDSDNNAGDLKKALLEQKWHYLDSLYPPGGTIQFYDNGKFHSRWKWNYWVAGPRLVHIQFWNAAYDPNTAIKLVFNEDLTRGTAEFVDGDRGRLHKIMLTRQ